ncbi:MAG: PTS sugar transporter subunit IIA [Nitrospirae bacterium]|nr:PTS sugar transporter subunit IIA [Nitrospirota bacterium]
MQLSVKDVAELLNVSEKTIYRMIRNETIPCFRVGGQWRFDRREINSWIEDTRAFSAKAGIDKYSSEDEALISIAEFMRRGGVMHSVSANTREDAIHACLAKIGGAISGLDTAGLFRSVMEREELCPTAIGSGIALPHPKTFGTFTKLSHISLCRLEKPIAFGALDNEDVDTLFFIFPKSERRFLRIQSKLLRLLKDDEVMSSVKKEPDGEAMLDLLSRKEAVIFGGEGK